MSESSAGHQPMRIIFSGVSGSYMPLWIAADAGYFREQGLDVELLLIESGTVATQALVAGEAFMAHVAAAAVINAILEGFDGVFVQATVQVPPLALFTRPDVPSPQGLVNGRLGITRFGSSTDIVGRLLLRSWGLDPERDLSMLQVGSIPELFAALQVGALDAAILSDPTSLLAAKHGFRNAADAGQLGIPYLHLGTVVSRAALDSQAELITRFLRGYRAGVDSFFADRALAVRVLGERTQQSDPEILAATYELYASKYISRDMLPRPETLAPILAAVSNPKARSIAPESLIDDRLVRELQAGNSPASR